MFTWIVFSLFVQTGNLAFGKEVWADPSAYYSHLEQRFNTSYELNLGSNFDLYSADDFSFAKYRQRRATPNCKKNEFTCLSKQCINNNLVCDGKDNCDDASDESPTLCYDIRCPDDYSSCYYGACIHNSLQCDGIENCKDGSDEDRTFCKEYISNQSQMQHKTNQPKVVPVCSNSTSDGKCISEVDNQGIFPSVNLLEEVTTSTVSTKEETNSSDPTKPVINPYLFTCFSGEKINDNLLCDGINDCYDGSDETIAQCIGIRCAGYLFQCAYGGCIEKSKLCNGEEDCKDGSDESSCGEKAHVPLRYCPKLVTESIEITCFHVEKEVNCSLPAWPGTLVKARCKPAYHRPEPLTGFMEAKCLAGGRWNHLLFTCVPDCGKRYTAKPLSWFTSTVSGLEYPWHVGLYINNGKDYRCGGSIISTKAVISAAHCVHDLRNKPGSVVIAVGKIWRDWKIKEPDDQRFKVIEIITGEGYRGTQSLFGGDIAILALERHINISITAMPICFDRDITYTSITSGVGTIVGWGKTENSSLSDKLRVTRLPIYPGLECEKLVLPLFVQYLTTDKFCGGIKGEKNASRLDVGDSGGSLIFPRKVKDKELYFLNGIVSLTDRDDPNAFTLFTNITKHTQWLNVVLKAIEKNKI